MPELLAADLKGVGRRFLPFAPVRSGVFCGHPAQQQDSLGDNQLRDTAGVGKGRVENCHARAGGGLQVNLVGADTEAAYGHQLFGGGKHILGQLGARAYADKVGIGDGVLELLGRQGFLVQLDIVVAGAFTVFPQPKGGRPPAAENGFCSFPATVVPLR